MDIRSLGLFACMLDHASSRKRPTPVGALDNSTHAHDVGSPIDPPHTERFLLFVLQLVCRRLTSPSASPSDLIKLSLQTIRLSGTWLDHATSTVRG
ncbi:hypothetical protein BDW68DRAFT_170133 [Aspergillus falconensis]